LSEWEAGKYSNGYMPGDGIKQRVELSTTKEGKGKGGTRRWVPKGR